MIGCARPAAAGDCRGQVGRVDEEVGKLSGRETLGDRRQPQVHLRQLGLAQSIQRVGVEEAPQRERQLVRFENVVTFAVHDWFR